MAHWYISDRADPRALVLADKHYNRQKIGAPQFVPPGRCLVLLTEDASALWVTSWPYAQYVRHAWAGAWVNSLFRNEGEILSSDLIREAVAVTQWYKETPYYEDGELKNKQWLSDPAPTLGIVSFVDANKTKRKRDPGRCYRKAGWAHVGFTAGGLYTLQLVTAAMGESAPPMGAEQLSFAA